MIYKTDAIVLVSRKYGDSSKIVNFFTRDLGKVATIAKGSRNPKSKFVSNLEALCYSQITFYNKDTRDIQTLSDISTIQSFHRIQSSMDHFVIGLMMMELISFTQQNKLQNTQLFDSTISILKELNHLPENQFNYFLFFGLHLFEDLGFGVAFDEDHQFEYPNIYFSLNEGYFTEILEPGAKNYLRIKLETYKLFDIVFKTELNKLNKIIFNYDLCYEFVNFIEEFISFHFERRFEFKSKVLLP